ncbi:MAG TPA: hypothetical protein VGK61_08595 [Planctomycetota bacterium]
MAEFVTRQEAQRRLWIVVGCGVISVPALVFGLISFKGILDQDKADQPGTVARLRKEIAEKAAANRQLRDNYRDYSKNIGWRNVSYSTVARAADAGFARPDQAAGLSPEALAQFLDWWVTDMFPRLDIKGYVLWKAEGPGDRLTLTKLFDELDKKEKDLVTKTGTLQADRDRDRKNGMDTAKETVRMDDDQLKQIDQAGTGFKDTYKQSLTQLRNNEQKYQLELDGDGTPANGGLAGQVYGLQAELTETRNYNLNLKGQLEQQKRELQNRINWLIYRQEEAKERKDPDGEILSVDSAQGLGFIDLLQADRIFRGGRFKVYSLEKGGEKRDKGEIEILEVAKEHASKVAIYNARAEDPIKSGDRIYNETYERGKARNIAMAGRLSGKLSNEDAIRKIKEFGDFYQERVSERTNYLIVGEGYEDDPNWKLAQEYGVKVMIEKIFLEYLGVPQ